MKPSAPPMAIEPMSTADLDEVMLIEEASYSVPWRRLMFEAELQGNSFARLFVARDPVGRELLGYVCFWVVFEELHIMNLSVRPDRRRMGIGRELVRWSLEKAKAENARSATLEVRASNQAARGLYERFGFKVTAVRTGYYREPTEDALIMSFSNG